jgi:hypothetical protein
MDPFLKILGVFFDPVVWGGALLIAAILAVVELIRIGKKGGRNGIGPESDERIS